MFADHGIGVVDLGVNPLGGLVWRLWRGTGVEELEWDPVVFAGDGLAVGFLDDVEETTSVKRDVSRLGVFD